MTKAQDLHDAILSNSASVVRELLETGADPSISPRLPLLANIRKQDTIPKKFWFARHVSATTITPLFMAVMSCYNNARTIHDDDGPANARTILELLIGAGTNVQHVAIDLVACNIEGFYSLGIDEPCTAKKLALFLKQHLNQVYSREQGKFLDEVIEELGRGNRLEFRDFGVFEIRERAARRAQNPKTLEQVEVPAKKTVKFKTGRLMKFRVDGPEDDAV